MQSNQACVQEWDHVAANTVKLPLRFIALQNRPGGSATAPRPPLRPVPVSALSADFIR